MGAPDTDSNYVGRFAPSPTGPLHFGSLLAAVASYLQARTHGGRWIVRIEDIDPPREQPGADKVILDALAAYGFEWDGPVVYQSRAHETHAALVASLIARGAAYPCRCSRRQLADAPIGPLGTIYPGTCRTGCDAPEAAIRVLTDNRPVRFTDGAQGPVSQRLQPESGDFVIRRRDGLIAYHLAVVADDFADGVTEVVRGIDLLDSTPRQIHLQRLLGFPTPAYLHIPVAVNADGQKLSKLTGAKAIPLDNAVPVLLAALKALRQPVSPGLKRCAIDRVWQWASENWNAATLAGLKHVAVPHAPLAEGQNGLR